MTVIDIASKGNLLCHTRALPPPTHKWKTTMPITPKLLRQHLRHICSHICLCNVLSHNDTCITYNIAYLGTLNKHNMPKFGILLSCSATIMNLIEKIFSCMTDECNPVALKGNMSLQYLCRQRGWSLPKKVYAYYKQLCEIPAAFQSVLCTYQWMGQVKEYCTVFCLYALICLPISNFRREVMPIGLKQFSTHSKEKKDNLIWESLSNSTFL